MPRKPIGETAMTDAERQARYRAARAAHTPIIRTRRPGDHRSRARRWTDHVTGLVKEQVEFMAWLDSLPERTARPPKRCARSANLISANFRRSFRPAASAGTTDPAPLALTHVMHRGPALRTRVAPMHD